MSYIRIFQPGAVHFQKCVCWLLVLVAKYTRHQAFLRGWVLQLRKLESDVKRPKRPRKSDRKQRQQDERSLGFQQNVLIPLIGSLFLVLHRKTVTRSRHLSHCAFPV